MPPALSSLSPAFPTSKPSGSGPLPVFVEVPVNSSNPNNEPVKDLDLPKQAKPLKKRVAQGNQSKDPQLGHQAGAESEQTTSQPSQGEWTAQELTPAEQESNAAVEAQAGSGVLGRGKSRKSSSVEGASSKKPVSLRDVARMANVSVATVSMVLNENPRISRATQLKVQRLIERVGYKPNRIAQSLSSKYTRVLAVMVPALRHTFADAYFGELISGICDRAGKLGQKVMIESAKPEFIRERRHIDLFERRYIDGVLLLGFNDRHGFLQDLASKQYPVVAVNNYFPSLGLASVCCDYRGGAEQVMNYLLQLGHRKIVLICGAPETQTQRDMIDVFHRKMIEAGLPSDGTMVEDGLFTEQGGAAAAQTLLARHPNATAIFGGNDKMAVGALHYLNRSGISVPGRISVTGFDDIQHTAFVYPALTTVHVPLYEAGALACERLVERIHGRPDRLQDRLPTHLVIRESTSMVPRISGS